MDSVVLLLNNDYEPLNVCNVRRAFRLVFGEKAEVIQYNHHDIRTATQIFRAPSVIRLHHRVKRPRPRVRLSRREIFVRDKYTCQYCGVQTHDLTLDHIIPRHRGGAHSWDNLVAACKHCNHRKGGRLVDEARMRLMRPPFEPRCDVYTLFTPVPCRSAQRGLARLPLHRAQLGRAPAQWQWRHTWTCRPTYSTSSTPSGATATPRTRWAAPCATRCSAERRRNGTWPRTRCPSGRWSCFRAAATRTSSARSASGRIAGAESEVTTFRRDHVYGDHRRPDSVTFTDSLDEDLARRDFTVNAIAWGRPAAADSSAEPDLVDPTGGLSDLQARHAARRRRSSRALRRGRASTSARGAVRGTARLRDRAAARSPA